jgi:hypothetical protein
MRLHELKIMLRGSDLARRPQFAHIYMGVRRLFPGEGKIFQGWQKHTICHKNTVFLKKKWKPYYFVRLWGGAGGGEGVRAPLALPCGRSCTFRHKKVMDGR